jgi:DNA-directed RNA polymerase subunit H
MNNTSSTISFLYKSRKTLLELLEIQGYDVNDYKNFSINEMLAMYQNNQLDMLLKNENEKKKIYVNYFLGKTLSSQVLQEIIDDLYFMDQVLTKGDTLLIVSRTDCNDTLTQLLKHVWERDGIFIIIQNSKRLQYNILNHSLVPKHRILTQEETEEVKRRYNIVNDSQFPDISRFDPVAQAIFMRPGQVCEITRYNKSAIMSYYYRICV